MCGLYTLKIQQQQDKQRVSWKFLVTLLGKINLPVTLNGIRLEDVCKHVYVKEEFPAVAQENNAGSFESVPSGSFQLLGLLDIQSCGLYEVCQ